MNDFERKLAQQAFREPPRDLRRLILARAEAAPRTNWLEWLWPSPRAWVGLAALWLMFAVFDAVQSSRDMPPPLLAQTHETSNAPALLTAHTPRDLQRALDLTN